MTTIEEIRAALVKPLRWKGPDGSGEYHSLDGLWGYIIRAKNGNGYWLTEAGCYHPTIDAAQAAAQADYNSRILSAIDATALLDRLAEVERERDSYAEYSRDNSMRAFQWMAAHDALKSGVPYEYPSPADLPNALTRAEAAEAERDELANDARDVIASASDTYKKRNGHLASFEDDSGEKCWIVPFDAFESLRATLAKMEAGKP